MSFNRTTQHAKSLVEKAVNRAGKSPKVFIPHKLAAYLDGIELALGGEARHVQSRGFAIKLNTNLIERFHGILKSRTKVMRGLKTPESALLFLDGWLAYYNFFRPHESLGNKTPAEKAGLSIPLKNWLDVVKQSKGSKRYTSLYPRGKISLGLPGKYNIRRRKRRRYVAPTVSAIRMSK